MFCSPIGSLAVFSAPQRGRSIRGGSTAAAAAALPCVREKEKHTGAQLRTTTSIAHSLRETDPYTSIYKIDIYRPWITGKAVNVSLPNLGRPATAAGRGISRQISRANADEWNDARNPWKISFSLLKTNNTKIMFVLELPSNRVERAPHRVQMMFCSVTRANWLKKGARWATAASQHYQRYTRKMNFQNKLGPATGETFSIGLQRETSPCHCSRRAYIWSTFVSLSFLRPPKTFVATKAATKFVCATDVLTFGEKQQGKPLTVKKNDPATIVVLRSVFGESAASIHLNGTNLFLFLLGAEGNFTKAVD